MALDTRLRCKTCYCVINTDIYIHFRLTRKEQTFTFCTQRCVDAYLDRCEETYIDIEHIAIGDKKKAVKDEVVDNRWQILDL